MYLYYYTVSHISLDFSGFQCPHDGCFYRFRISYYFNEILPKDEKGDINFDLDDWRLDYTKVVDEEGVPIWRKNSNPLRNLRKSFTNHYDRFHRVIDMPWCLQTNQQRMQTQSFFAKEAEESSVCSVSSDSSDSSESRESSDTSESSDSSVSSESSSESSSSSS